MRELESVLIVDGGGARVSIYLTASEADPA
jgi:hypothetical protein